MEKERKVELGEIAGKRLNLIKTYCMEWIQLKTTLFKYVKHRDKRQTNKNQQKPTRCMHFFAGFVPWEWLELTECNLGMVTVVCIALFQAAEYALSVILNCFSLLSATTAK